MHKQCHKDTDKQTELENKYNRLEGKSGVNHLQLIGKHHVER